MPTAPFRLEKKRKKNSGSTSSGEVAKFQRPVLLGGDTCQKSEGEHLQNDGYFLLEGGIEVAFISFCLQPCPHLSEQILNLESVSFVCPLFFYELLFSFFFAIVGMMLK